LPFGDDQLKAIFSLPLFKPPHKIPRAAHGEVGFWLPLISLLSGMRIEEISQLNAADVKRKNDIDYFDVTTLITSDDDRDDDEVYVKSLKTASARREIPIHPQLVALGFLDYVAEQRQIKSRGRLFPALQAYKGRYSKEISKWWGRYQDKCVTDSKHFTFHSFRHNFVSALRNANVADEAIKGLVGHAGSNVTSQYGLPQTLTTRRSMVDRVVFPSVDFTCVRRPMVGV
jgi:integrase